MPSIAEIPRPLWLLYAGTTIVRSGAFVVPYLTIYLSDELGLSLSVTGQVIAIGGVGLLLGNIGGGWLADRVGRKFTLLLGLLVNAVGITALAVPLSSASAYSGALFGALLGAGMYMPAANALIADLTSTEVRPLAYTVHYVCINVGMGLGPLLAGLVAASSFFWVFAGDLTSTVICAAVLWLGLPSIRSRASAPTEQSSRSMLEVWRAHPRVMLFCIASVFVVAPLMGLEYTVPLLVGRVFDRPLVFVGVVYSINALCILVLSFPIERVVRGRDAPTMMALAAALWALGLTILFVGHSVAALLVCTVVWTLGEIIGSIVVPTFVSQHVAPQAKGRMLAVQDAVRSACAIGCPLVLGIVWEQAGVHIVVGGLVAVPLVGMAVYAAIRAMHSRRVHPMVPGGS